MDEAGEFFLKKIHGLELSGDLQKAVIEYRQSKQKLDSKDKEGLEELFNRYHEMIVDLYREDLEFWINQNLVINLTLKTR